MTNMSSSIKLYKIFISHPKSTFFFFGLQSMWFIPIYVYSSILYDFIFCKSGKKQKILLCVLIVAVLVLLERYSSPFRLRGIFGKTICGLSFLLIGDLLSEWIGGLTGTVTAVCLAVFSFLGIWNGFVSMNFEFGRLPVLFFVNATVLSCSICFMMKNYYTVIPDKIRSFLSMYGQYSIVILVTNNLIIEIVRLLDYKLTGNFFLNHGETGNLLFGCLLIILEYPFIMMAKGRLGFLFGKGNKR